MTTLDYTTRFFRLSTELKLSGSSVYIFTQIIRTLNDRFRKPNEREMPTKMDWYITNFSQDTGYTRSTVKKALDELQRKKLLTYSTTRGRSNGHVTIEIQAEIFGSFEAQPEPTTYDNSIKNEHLTDLKRSKIEHLDNSKRLKNDHLDDFKRSKIGHLKNEQETALQAIQADICKKIDGLEKQFAQILTVLGNSNVQSNVQSNDQKLRNPLENIEIDNTISVEVSNETFDAPAESQNVEPKKQPKPKTKKQPETDPAKIQANVKQSIVLYLFSEYVKADGVPPPRFGAAEAKAAKDFAQKLSDLIDLKLKNGEVQTPNEIGSFYVDLRGRKVNFDTNPRAKQNDATRATESPVLRLFAKYCAKFFDNAYNLPDKFLSQTRDLKIFNSKFNDFYVKFTNPSPTGQPINGADPNESFEQAMERFTNAIT